MKKTALLLTLALVLGVFASCAGNGGDTVGNDTSDTDGVTEPNRAV